MRHEMLFTILVSFFPLIVAIVGIYLNYRYWLKKRKEVYRQLLYGRKLEAYTKIYEALFKYYRFWFNHKEITEDLAEHERLLRALDHAVVRNLLYLSDGAVGLLTSMQESFGLMTSRERESLYDKFRILLFLFQRDLGIVPLTKDMRSLFVEKRFLFANKELEEDHVD